MLKILDARFVVSAVSEEGYPPRDLPEVAFAGRSNVGKSSMINALLQRRRLVRVSKTPGRTRALNFFEVNVELNGARDRIRFTDLPGYGFARVSKQVRNEWGPMITSYLGSRANLRQVVLIVDSEVGATSSDLEALEYLRTIGRSLLIVATKMDRLPKSKRKPALGKISLQLKVNPQIVLPFSARETLGVDSVWESIFIDLFKS